MKTRSKATIAALESKIANLEEQLEVEARERQALGRATRRQEKRCKEILAQAEEERRHADSYKEQVRRVGYCLVICRQRRRGDMLTPTKNR